MTDRFSELLSELGKIFQLTLSPDKYNACSIEVPPLTIQLELDPTQENLYLFTKIIDLPPGRFRENTLSEALKVNSLPDPRPGIFGYIARTNHLALYQVYPVNILNGDRLAELFGSFFEMGESWHKSIQGGQSGPVLTGKPLPFGMRP
jgi:hypothetical protein